MKRIPTEVYQRTVGYYQTLSTTNPGKRAEIMDRRDGLTKEKIYEKKEGLAWNG
jgi:hypothetical protein